MKVDSENEGQQIINMIDLVMDDLNEVARQATTYADLAFASLARMRTIRAAVCAETDAAEQAEDAVEQARRQVGGRG